MNREERLEDAVKAGVTAAHSSGFIATPYMCVAFTRTTADYHHRVLCGAANLRGPATELDGSPLSIADHPLRTAPRAVPHWQRILLLEPALDCLSDCARVPLSASPEGTAATETPPEAPDCVVETMHVDRIVRRATRTLIETADSVWVYDTGTRMHMEGQCPVYRVTCVRGPCKGADLVIKVAGEPAQARALAHEARVMRAAADCEHIAELAYPPISDGYFAFLVQPRPSGCLGQLATRFASIAPRLTWGRLLDVAAQAFLALQRVHALDLVHTKAGFDSVQFHDATGDLSPPVIKLANLDASVLPASFALAPVLSVLTAPEARASVYVADFAMDVYSLAVALAGFIRQVLSASLASSGAPGAALRAVPPLMAASPWPSRASTSSSAWLPPQVANVLRACTEQDPRRRCSAADAAAAFSALLDSDLASQLCNQRPAAELWQ